MATASPSRDRNANDGENKTSHEPQESNLRDALLAELRQDLIICKIDQIEIERLGIALKNGLISVRQCLALQRDPAIWGAAS